MKSKTILILLLISQISLCQSPLPLRKNQLNVGIGLSEYGKPIYLGIDHSAHKDITLGAEMSYRGYREYWKKNYYRHNIIQLSGNANYHFNSALRIPRKWDFYAGINAGFTFWSSPNDYDGSYSSGLGVGAQLGGRYYFNNKVGINLEFGNGYAFYGGKIGLSFKL